jgi:TM2 domain-containing membrane protein YozV
LKFVYYISFILSTCYALPFNAQQVDSVIVNTDSTVSVPIIANVEQKKEIVITDTNKHSPIVKYYKKKWKAALLAFPLPFGVVGLHRVYLGTKPYVPIVYVATVGGVFGLLPLADFIAILTSKEEDLQNFDSGKVFFWIKK